MELVLTVIFSALLLPVNLFCSFWLFREALDLSGVTFGEIRRDLSDSLRIGTHMRRRKTKIILTYLTAKSADPAATKRLFYGYAWSTLPGLAALILAEYAAVSRHPEKLTLALFGDLILVLVNLALVMAGRVYRKNHPLDDKIAEKLAQTRVREREENQGHRVRNGVVYAVVGVSFLTMFMGFQLAVIGVARSSQQPSVTPGEGAVDTVDYYRMNTVLNARGFETANIPTTYWQYDEDKLVHVCAGVKGNTKFEFYEYSDGETTDLVYNQIIYDIAPDMEPDERERHETILPDRIKMFTVIIDGVYHCVLYQNNTAVYAYSSASMDEINEILFDIGYLKSR